MMKRHYLELIWYKAIADLRAEASRAYLGILWWVIEPLLYMTIFYIVFGLVFQRGGEGFVAFLLCGLVFWKWFDSTVRSGSVSIRSNASLMQQTYLPKYVFPAVVLITNSLKFIIILVLLLIFLLLYGVHPTATWAALPLLVAVQFFLVMAVSWLMAAIVPFVPDLKLILDYGLTLLFFLSGIFFDINHIPAGLAGYFRINPMAVMIEGYRDILIDGQWPEWSTLFMVLIFSLIVLVAAIRLLISYNRVYPKVLI